MFAHTRSRGRPSNPLIGFIRASSITFSQGYTLASSRAQQRVFTTVISRLHPTATRRVLNARAD